MSQLIALVATAVMVDGERVVIQPGQALPNLSARDAAELLHAGAAQPEPGEGAAPQGAESGAPDKGAKKNVKAPAKPAA